VRKVLPIALLIAAALLLVACGGGSSSSSGRSTAAANGAATGNGAETGGGTGRGAGGAKGAAKTPEQIWAKEVEGVMRDFENSSAQSVTMMHTDTSQLNLEPTYAAYSKELAALGKELEATKAPARCEQQRKRMGVLSRKVSAILGVLADQHQLSPEEYSALVFQQRYKFARVGRKLTNLTIYVHC
jgi:hypothetical protein